MSSERRDEFAKQLRSLYFDELCRHKTPTPIDALVDAASDALDTMATVLKLDLHLYRNEHSLHAYNQSSNPSNHTVTTSNGLDFLASARVASHVHVEPQFSMSIYGPYFGFGTGPMSGTDHGDVRFLEAALKTVTDLEVVNFPGYGKIWTNQPLLHVDWNDAVPSAAQRQKVIEAFTLFNQLYDPAINYTNLLRPAVDMITPRLLELARAGGKK